MKLKELVNESGKNVLNFIDYFNDIEDKEKYWLELSIKYGERELLPCIEEMFNSYGATGVGLVFSLRSNDWKKYAKAINLMEDIVNQEDKTITTGKGNNDSIRNSDNTENTSNNEKVFPFDDNLEVDNSTSKGVNNRKGEETYKENRTDEKTVIREGFNKDKLNYIERFYNSYGYRFKIYTDIVNMLCLQLY